MADERQWKGQRQVKVKAVERTVEMAVERAVGRLRTAVKMQQQHNTGRAANDRKGSERRGKTHSGQAVRVLDRSSTRVVSSAADCGTTREGVSLWQTAGSGGQGKAQVSSGNFSGSARKASALGPTAAEAHEKAVCHLGRQLVVLLEKQLCKALKRQ